MNESSSLVRKVIPALSSRWMCCLATSATRRSWSVWLACADAEHEVLAGAGAEGEALGIPGRHVEDQATGRAAAIMKRQGTWLSSCVAFIYGGRWPRAKG